MEVQHKTCKRTHNQTINCASLCCCRFHTSTTTSPRSILTWCTSKRSTSWTSTMTAASATTSTSVSSAASTTKTSCKTSSSTFVGLSKNGSGLSHCLAYTFRWGSTMFPPMFDTIEHGCMFQHIRKDNEHNFRSSYVYLIDFTFYSIGVSNHSILNVQVHLIFGFKEQSSYEFPSFGFDFHHSPFGVVQDDNWDTYTIVANDRHGEYLSLESEL
mmetsp:Transcript_7854/g.12457  ORF Transcript_7854/g.12457 Transcript_7854/m.12457 type:complete len:214 (+) Transcript_7854:1048-1689(+)